MRLCTKCRVERPENEFPKRKDGKFYFCNFCITEYNKNYYAAHKQEIKAQTKHWQQTHQLEVSRQHKKYYDTHKKEVAEQHKRYRDSHPIEIAEQQKCWSIAHPEKVRERVSRWQINHRQECAESAKRYRDSHPEKIKEYKINHKNTPEGIASGDRCYNRRRARQQSAFVEDVDRQDIFQRDGWRCQICGKKVNPKYKWPHPKCATLDHIIPYAQDGTHESKNVQLAHLKCNLQKWTNAVGCQLRVFG